MAKNLSLRLLRVLAVLWLVSIATFSLISFLPGDPARNILGPEATAQQVDYLRGQLGLDKPFVERYLDWMGGILTLDFGETLARPVQPVSTVIGDALPVTLQLAVMALVLGLAGGLLLGSVAAYRPGSRLDQAITGGSFALISIPAFVLALFLIRIFVFDHELAKQILLVAGIAGTVLLAWGRVQRRERLVSGLGSAAALLWPVAAGVLLFLVLPEFPRSGWVRPTENLGENLRYATLPAITLAAGLVPLYAQLLRTDMVATLRQNFITVSRAKGMSPRHVVVKEALRPSMFSLVTVAGISFGNLVGGSVIVESIFGMPGLGSVLIKGINARDFAVVQIAVLVAAALFLLLNMLVDIAYNFLDPRLRRAGH